MEVRYDLTHKQLAAWMPLIFEGDGKRSGDCTLLYGGAKGGGKSWLLCLWAFYWAKRLIDIFGIKEPLKYPLPVGFIGRKRSVDFSKTTLETWKKVIPAGSYEIREQDKEIVIEGKVKLFFGGLDDQEIINKFNSAELAYFALDQAEETDRSDISTLEASLRLKYAGIQPPYKKLYTANPAECWLREDFISTPKTGYIYIPALPSDNPHLPSNYNQTLEDAFGYDPVLLDAYKNGNWDTLSTHAALITQQSLELLKDIVFDWVVRKTVVSCDPSLGGDECVLKYFENYEEKDQKILHMNDIQKIGAEAVAWMNEKKTRNFACDTCGLGIGVANYVAAMGMSVVMVNSSESSTDPEHVANRRGDLWYNLALKINRREIPYPTDEKTRRQICAVKHKQGTKKFELVPKALTKKTLGESPDRGDAFAIGIWAIDQIDAALSVSTAPNKRPAFVGAGGW